MPIDHRLRLSSPADILTAIPYLLGFHPADSLVVIGVEHAAVRVATRWDLPLAPGALGDLLPLLAREKADATLLAAFGEAALTAPALDEALRFLSAAGVGVHDALRTHDGRYWSHLHACPPGGVHYDTAAHPVAAEAVVRGMVALPDRQTLERTLAPVTGPARTAMDLVRRTRRTRGVELGGEGRSGRLPGRRHRPGALGRGDPRARRAAVRRRRWPGWAWRCG